jgi:aspartate aminotransferase
VLVRRDPWVAVQNPAAELTPSATLESEANAKKLVDGGGRVVRLGLGQSPFPPPEFVTSALRAHVHDTDYAPIGGTPGLRAGVARDHARRLGLDIRPEDVVIGPGSKCLIFLLQLVFEGEVMLPSPGWVSYGPQARWLGHRVTQIPTTAADRWQVCASTLERTCRGMRPGPRLLVLNSPSNPAGTSLRRDELEGIAQVAREHRLLVLSDEIYGRLHHRAEHASLATHYPEGTIVSGGLSKWAAAGGWRIGQLVFPRQLWRLRDTVLAAVSESFTSTCAPVQHAAEVALRRRRHAERYLESVRAVLASLARELLQLLRSTGIEVVEPDGGFYLFPDFGSRRVQLERRGIRDSRELCVRLLEECGVSALPGCEFGRPPTELTMRLAYVDFDGEAALRSARRCLGRGERLDSRWVRAYGAPTIDAVARVCEWLSR